MTENHIGASPRRGRPHSLSFAFIRVHSWLLPFVSIRIDKPGQDRQAFGMAENPEAPLDRLWREYSLIFRDFDDLTLARWMAQTLGQLEGHGWRLSHPLVGSYRLAAQIGADRQIWLKRLVSAPAGYQISECCRAPLLPLLTRDVLESGLLCLHCNNTAIALDDLPPDLHSPIQRWASEYSTVHAVAHWDEDQQRRAGDYDRAFEQAAKEAEKLLVLAGKELVPKIAEIYTIALWEDHDECLEIEPEDLLLQ